METRREGTARTATHDTVIRFGPLLVIPREEIGSALDGIRQVVEKAIEQDSGVASQESGG